MSKGVKGDEPLSWHMVDISEFAKMSNEERALSEALDEAANGIRWLPGSWARHVTAALNKRGYAIISNTQRYDKEYLAQQRKILQQDYRISSVTLFPKDASAMGEEPLSHNPYRIAFELFDLLGVPHQAEKADEQGG